MCVQNQILLCDMDPDCDIDPLIPLLSAACLSCLVAHEGGDGPPPIEPCLSDGVVYEGPPTAVPAPAPPTAVPAPAPPADGPPACVLDQLVPFMEAEDEMGMVQYICSDQFNTSTCDDAETANINDNVPLMCAELAEMGGGDGDAAPACVLDQMMPFIVAEDEMGMVQYICSDQFDTSTCNDAEMADMEFIPGMCAGLGPPPVQSAIVSEDDLEILGIWGLSGCWQKCYDSAVPTPTIAHTDTNLQSRPSNQSPSPNSLLMFTGAGARNPGIRNECRVGQHVSQ
eukprot:COSAG02_NODE_11045_length_1805_cov_11.577960_2_plen_284_part_00